jgi:hypothetical protein
MARGSGTLRARLLPLAKTEVRRYLKKKGAQGGFKQEGLLIFLQTAEDDPVTWNVAAHAQESLTLLYDRAWAELHDDVVKNERAELRRELLDALQAFAEGNLDEEELRRASELLDRARKIADNERAWDRRPEADKSRLAKLCELAGVDDGEEEAAADDPQMEFKFTFAGGKKIRGRALAYRDITVPGKMRSVLSFLATIGQYERHVAMLRANRDATNDALDEEEKKLAWLIDAADGDRNARIFDHRDRIPEPDGDRPGDKPRS